MSGESWTSWSGRVRCTPARIEAPRSDAEVAGAVRRAASEGRRVRAAGAGHSHTPLVATDGVLLCLDALRGIESFDSGSLEATIRAGTRIHDLGEPLRALGGALANQGDVDTQAIAGAVATGTHGTGPKLGSISSRVSAIRFVDAQGGVREWPDSDVRMDAPSRTPGDAEARASGATTHDSAPTPRDSRNAAGDRRDRLDAARVSLGALGVVTAVRLRLVPPYRLHERIWREPVEEALARLDERIGATRHFELFWLPGKDVAELKTLDPTDASPESVAGRKRERIDWSDRIFPSIREVRFNEMEYAVPAVAGPACFQAVRERMQARHPDVIWPVEYRTLAADDAWLGPAHGRETVTISLHQGADLPCDEFFGDVEAIFREHEGRPHWGKVHFRSGPELAPLYPRWEDFRRLRRALDPEGRFLNDHLRSLFEPESARGHGDP